MRALSCWTQEKHIRYVRKHKNILGIDGNDIIKTWSFMGVRKVPQFVSQVGV
jgi:hypothetical protein